MPNKIILALALLLSFASGRWLSPTKTVTQIKTVEVEKKVDATNTQIDDHKTTTIVVKPDGTSQTTITDDSHTGTKSTDTTQLIDSTESTETVTRGSSKLTLSALASSNIHSLGQSPDFGAMVTKQVLGPITATAFGLSSGVFGVGIGLSF